MSDQVLKCFVGTFVNFIKKQIAERNYGADIVGSLEAAEQCLQAAFGLADDGQAPITDNPLAAINLFEMFEKCGANIHGHSLMKQRKYKEAAAAFTSAIESDPANAVYYYNRSAAYMGLGDYKNVVQDCEKAIDLKMKNAQLYARLGMAYGRLNQLELALQAYLIASNLDPECIEYSTKLVSTKLSLVLEESKPAETPIKDMDVSSFGHSDLDAVSKRILSNPTIRGLITRLHATGTMPQVFEAGQQMMVELKEENRELFERLHHHMEDIFGTAETKPDAEGAPSNDKPPAPPSK